MERGFVMVDEGMRTNVPGIYAIGDITGKIQLAHVASAQGIVAAENTAGGSKKCVMIVCRPAFIRRRRLPAQV